MSAFADVLSHYLADLGLSQSALARDMMANHSYVSRLLAGQRHPTREMVNRIADALTLTPAGRDHLLLSAGFAPESPIIPITAESEIQAAVRALRDPAIPEARKAWLRRSIGLAVEGVESEAA